MLNDQSMLYNFEPNPNQFIVGEADLDVQLLSQTLPDAP